MSRHEIEDTAQKIMSQAGSAEDNALREMAAFSGRAPETRNEAQAGLGQVKDQLHEAAARTAEFAHDLYERPQEHLERGQRAIAEQFNQNPLLTVVIAGVAGLFLGFLIGRESR